MREKKQLEYLKNKKADSTPAELNEDINKLIGISMARVFKEYLPTVSETYQVKKAINDYSPDESVACFDITKLVIEKDDNVIDKLKNVYHLLAYSNNSIALIINRKHSGCRISLAVGIRNRDSESVKNLTKNVQDAFNGNFPGSECSDIDHYSDENDGVFQPLNERAYFSSMNFDSVGIVSNIATDYTDDFLNQSLEKLIDGICPPVGSEYTIVLLGEALDSNALQQKKDELYGIYTALSPFSKRGKNWGVNQGKNWSSNWNANVFGTLGMNKGNNTIGGSNGMNAGLGASFGGGHTWGGSVGVSEGDNIEIIQYSVYHTQEIIEKQMQRLEQCEALGLWDFAAYVFSTEVNLVNEVSHMYMSLTQGNESFYEKPSINIWNAQSQAERSRNQIKMIRTYISHLEHPVFEKRPATSGMKEYLNSNNWPDEITCTTTVSGADLSRALNLPRSSVPGLAVIECVPFGREITSYDKKTIGDICIGKIHHMHHDEEKLVNLSSDSLTSHVFVTGSTGSGKSNTVYTLLEAAKTPFLVIEPAKGEYRKAFGDDVYKFGTNYSMGDILQINPFVFPEGIHVYEHIDRLLDVFNVCWPMYAAMPAVLKDAIIRAYEKVGWNMRSSRNDNGRLYPTFEDVCDEIDFIINNSDYSDENKGNYRGSLKTRLKSLTNGINGLIFCEGNIPDSILFDSKTIVDLSRVGSAENKSLIMGILVIKLQEYRMCRPEGVDNEKLKHITVLEEAHNLLRNSFASSSPEMGGGVAAKSVEMLANAIAEMRTYGEGFVIVDQAPGLLDMSVIRNTNTKIIMRLPDQSDRELVGKAANLNDNQIEEIAKLQRGIAAIYQNEWIQPILCHVIKHNKNENTAEKASWINKSKEINEDEQKYVASCIYDPYYLAKKSDISFIDCLDKMDISDSLRLLLVDYARTPMPKRQELYSESCYRFFRMQKFFDESAYDVSAKEWSDSLIKYVKENNKFTEDTDFSKFSGARYIFTQAMISTYMIKLGKNNQNIEMAERVEKLNGFMSDIKNHRI